MTGKVKIEVEVDLTAQIAAAWFCGLNDEEQADFFIACAKIAKSWPGGGGSQWQFVGSHLRTCSCATDEARDMIRDLHYGLENSK